MKKNTKNSKIRFRNRKKKSEAKRNFFLIRHVNFMTCLSKLGFGQLGQFVVLFSKNSAIEKPFPEKITEQTRAKI